MAFDPHEALEGVHAAVVVTEWSEVRNLDLAHPTLAGDDPTIVAVAANGPAGDTPLPVFDRDDVTALVGFIEKHTGLT